MRTLIIWSFAALGAVVPSVALAGDWGSLRGSGNLITESRPLADFTEVANGTPLDVEITRADKFSVSVTVDDNIAKVLETTVSSGRLRISTPDRASIHPSSKSIVRITLPVLSAVTLTGSGDTSAKGFSSTAPFAVKTTGSGDFSFDGTTGDITLTAQGSGTTRLSGQAGKLDATLNGSGTIEGTDFRAKGAKLELNGSGKIVLTVDGDLNVDARGSGSVKATCDHGTVTARLFGSGSVRWTGSCSQGPVTSHGSGEVRHE